MESKKGDVNYTQKDFQLNNFLLIKIINPLDISKN